MTTPEPTVIDVTLPKKGPLNDVVMFGSLLMMGFICYLLWQQHRRLKESDARFQDSVRTLKERFENRSSGPASAQREVYDAGACSPDCVQGHTYNRGCVQYVEPSDEQQETL